MDRNTTTPRPRKPTKLLVLAVVVTVSLTGGLWWYFSQPAAPVATKPSAQAEPARVEKPTQPTVANEFTLENVPLAGLPWSHDLEHPSVVALGSFKVPWIRSVAEPALVKIDLAVLPWQRQLQLGTLAQKPSPTGSLATGGSFVDQAQVPWVRSVAPPKIGIDTASVPWAATPAMSGGSTVAPTPVTIDMAVVPWVRTGPKAVPNAGIDIASVPWGSVSPTPTGSTAIPTPATVDLAQVPWSSSAQSTADARLQVDVPSAVVPFVAVHRDNQVVYVTIPLDRLSGPRRDPGKAQAVSVALAEPSYDASVTAHKPKPIVPMLDVQRSSDLFIVALTQDSQGDIWVGTEDQGVWRLDPTAPAGEQWKQFTTKNGLGDDDAYALTCDRLGRVWVGHLNHGVSVYNGVIWKNYDVTTGPLGERIFALATSPVDGDVWMASSAGLARYSLQHDNWSYYTRAEGLPSDQASSLAFDKDGTLYVGTQCDGIAMADTKDDYKTWRTVHAKEEYQEHPPTVPAGDGLPTDLINQVLVAKDQTIYAATTTGLAWSSDKGKTWKFSRGQNWAAKVRGLNGGPPKNWTETEGAEIVEDYITCLAEDEAGMLWIGTRQRGYQIIEPHHFIHQFISSEDPGREQSYVSALLPRHMAPALVGQYQGGLLESTTFFGIGSRRQPVDSSSFAVAVLRPLPAPATPPTESEIGGILTRIKTPGEYARSTCYLGEDWSTQGDWVGRYGRQYAILCAADAPRNHDISYGQSYKVQARLGPHKNAGDQLRHWIHWLKTENHSSLYDPMIGTRRQAEWDDHGEAYPDTFEGPDILASVSVPPGVHRISLYFFNKDGHGGANRYRDYVVELRSGPRIPGDRESTSMARTRVRDFWGGVYKQFLITGPCTCEVKIAKNSSFNTICSAVLIDRLYGPLTNVDRLPLAWMGGVQYCPSTQPYVGAPDETGDPKSAAVHNLSTTAGPTAIDRTAIIPALDECYVSMASANWQRTYRLQAYRDAVAHLASPVLLQSWRWNLCVWTPEDRAEFQKKMAQGWSAMQKANSDLTLTKFRPHSPGVGPGLQQSTFFGQP